MNTTVTSLYGTFLAIAVIVGLLVLILWIILPFMVASIGSKLDRIEKLLQQIVDKK